MELNESLQFDTATKTLDKLTSLSFTEPVSFRFSRCQAQPVESWRDLYGGVLKHLCQQHLDIVKTVLPAEEIGDLKLSKKMKNPFWVRRGIYAETGLNPDTIVRRIRLVVDACALKPTDLKITYYVDEARKQAYEERVEREKSESKILQLRWDYTGTYKGARAVSFRYKNHRTRQVKSWTDLYVQFISFLADDYPKIIKDGVSFGDKRVDVCRAGKKKKAMGNPARIGHNLFVEAWGTGSMLIDRMYNALLLCKVDPSCLVINFTFKDADNTFAYLGKNSKLGKGVESEVIANLDGKLIRRLRFLLGKQFEDGYRLESAIDRSRLSGFYAEQYQEELTVTDEELKIALLTIASPIGGRILPHKQTAVNSLMSTIMGTIAETFTGGATCIYTSELFKRYHADLAAYGVHDEKSLEELVLRNSGNNYRIKYNHICYGRKKADVESEIITFLRDSVEPVSLDTLDGYFWYIPSAVLERELYNAESVVSPAVKMYYCALNLPISTSEKSQIRESMKSFFTVRQEMTEVELLDAVLQVCPHLLAEVSFLSWRGLRDSLAYVFRDVIIFQDSLILSR